MLTIMIAAADDDDGDDGDDDGGDDDVDDDESGYFDGDGVGGIGWWWWRWRWWWWWRWRRRQWRRRLHCVCKFGWRWGRGGYLCMFGINVLTMMLLPKQFKLQSFPNAMQQPGPRAAHITRGVDILAACCAETRTQIDQKKYYCSKKQTGRKEIVFDRRNGKKEGGREGRKDDRKTACTFQFTHVTFKQLQVLRNLHVLVSKMWRPPCILEILAATRCKHHVIMCSAQTIIPHATNIAFQLQPWASESCKIASNLQMSVSICCKCHAACKW